MNDLYNERITTERGEYRYDPDMDAYYRIHRHEETHFMRWGWLYMCLITLIFSLLYFIP